MLVFLHNDMNSLLNQYVNLQDPLFMFQLLNL